MINTYRNHLRPRVRIEAKAVHFVLSSEVIAENAATEMNHVSGASHVCSITHCTASSEHSVSRWWYESSRQVFVFGLVRIRPLRSVLTISEPWDEGDGFE